MSSSRSCHGRWCPALVPGFERPDTQNCTDVTRTFQTYFLENWFTYQADYESSLACCKLYCGQHSQLLILQCQGISKKIGILLWLMVPILVLSALAFLFMSFVIERGGRKVAMVGGALFLSYISAIVFTFSEDRGSVYVDTPLYPIVGALNVAAYSYFFAGYQYSIGLIYELLSASALIFTMFPIWTLLTIDINLLLSIRLSHSSTQPAKESARLVLAMLVLSVLWIIHSSLYRTVGYRAAWIAAFKNQRCEHGTNYMSNLWVLAAAQGHPTWMTPAGRSIGLCLAALSWGVSAKSHIFLEHECHDDLILFHIMLWTPPVILTLAMLATQLKMFLRVPCNVEGTDNSLLSEIWGEFQSVRGIHNDYQEALISYRLGRDTMEVENNIDRFRFSCGRICWDRVIAKLVRRIETGIYVVVLLGALVIQIAHWLGRCGLQCTSTLNTLGMWQRLQPSRMVKIRAFRILCQNWLGEEASPYYDETHGVTDYQIDQEVCRILREHRRDIRLPLLLDNIDPSGLAYLLQQLVNVLNEARDQQRVNELNEANQQRVNELNEARDQQHVNVLNEARDQQRVNELNEARDQAGESENSTSENSSVSGFLEPNSSTTPLVIDQLELQQDERDEELGPESAAIPKPDGTLSNTRSSGIFLMVNEEDQSKIKSA